MSSDYHLLCLTHDPALEIQTDWTEPEPALAAAASPATHEIVAGHVGCDLLVGRYSFPLIEVACPDSRRIIRADHRGWHSAPKWVGVEWLRLLWRANAQNPAHPGLLDAVRDASQLCWTVARVHRLRYAIGALPADEAPAGRCCAECSANRSTS